MKNHRSFSNINLAAFQCKNKTHNITMEQPSAKRKLAITTFREVILQADLEKKHWAENS